MTAVRINAGPHLLISALRKLYTRKRYTPLELRQLAVDWGTRRGWPPTVGAKALDALDEWERQGRGEWVS